MFSAIYVEDEIADSPRVAEIIGRVPNVPVISCGRYGEVFNRKAQNFRLQKQRPALILAKKHGNLVLPAPAGYGFNGQPSFYFSHMLNCLYDCRYCFLQGMYQSANYVLFVNYEDFAQALMDKFNSDSGPAVFYSGYDCDSLALEPVSRFSEYYLPLFAQHQDATLEIRTKSTQVRSLLEMQPLPNVIIAMSFTASNAALKLEHKVPALEKRLEALAKLQRAGWPVALRFEPLIADANFLSEYQQLFQLLFAELDGDKIHSVSTGLFRMPVDYFKKIVKLYPDEPLFARETEVSNGVISLRNSDEHVQLDALEQQLLQFISADKYYRCAD